MPEKPLAEVPDAELVKSAGNTGNRDAAYTVEMMRRLKDALEVQERSSTRLGERIRKLNVWLLWVTMAIGALTIVQVLAAMKVIGR